MKKGLDNETMAKRAAQEFQDGMVVNLGFGIPTLAANFAAEGKRIIFHAENGILGYGPIVPEGQEVDPDLINPGGQYVRPLPGMSVFNHDDAFDMIRGEHIDLVVLGALQVSRKGDLANWFNPAKGIGNIGGAMDLAVGAKRVIVVMEHTTRDGKPKILNECTFPLTAKECVDLIITDIATIEVTPKGLVLKEFAPGWSSEEVQSLIEPKLKVADDLKAMDSGF
jgi:3-oxoacid CoA-transferase subunit B